MVSLRDQRHQWTLRGHRSPLPGKYVLLQRPIGFASPMGLSHMVCLGCAIKSMEDGRTRYKSTDQPTQALRSSGPSGPYRTRFKSSPSNTQYHNTSTRDKRSNMIAAEGLTIGAAAIRRRELTGKTGMSALMENKKLSSLLSSLHLVVCYTDTSKEC